MNLGKLLSIAGTQPRLTRKEWELVTNKSGHHRLGELEALDDEALATLLRSETGWNSRSYPMCTVVTLIRAAQQLRCAGLSCTRVRLGIRPADLTLLEQLMIVAGDPDRADEIMKLVRRSTLYRRVAARLMRDTELPVEQHLFMRESNGQLSPKGTCAYWQAVVDHIRVDRMTQMVSRAVSLETALGLS